MGAEFLSNIILLTLDRKKKGNEKMKKYKYLFILPIIALFVGAIFFFAGSLKESSSGAEYGNGVDINSGASFVFSGGTISSDRQVDYGGGVAVYDGSFTMNGGSIKGNNATYGGGVYVRSGSTFTMGYGTISGNSATYGGGVYVEGTFNMNGGTIQSNSSSNNGADVYIAPSGTFNYYSGTISGNIYTSKAINITRSPSSKLNIYFENVMHGTRIAKLSSGVSFYSSYYNIVNMPSTMKLEQQGDYIVAIATGITFTVGGSGTGTLTAYADNSSGYQTGLKTYDLNDYWFYEYSQGGGIHYFVDNFGFNLIQEIGIIEDGDETGSDGERQPLHSNGWISAAPGSNSQFVGWFINGKRVDNSMSFYERILRYGDIVTAKFEPASYTLAFNMKNIGSSANSDLFGEVIGSGVKKVGTGQYLVRYAPNTQIKFMRGSFTIGENKVTVAPKLGYILENVTGISGSSETLAQEHCYTIPSANGNYTINCTFMDYYTVHPMIRVAYDGRAELTRNETIFLYGYIYWTSCNAKRMTCPEEDYPLVDVSYYDNYSTEEINKYVANCTKWQNATGHFGDGTNQYCNIWITDKCISLGKMPSEYESANISQVGYLREFYNNQPLGDSVLLPIGNEVTSGIRTDMDYDLNEYFIFWRYDLEDKYKYIFGSDYFYEIPPEPYILNASTRAISSNTTGLRGIYYRDPNDQIDAAELLNGLAQNVSVSKENFYNFSLETYDDYMEIFPDFIIVSMEWIRHNQIPMSPDYWNVAPFESLFENIFASVQRSNLSKQEIDSMIEYFNNSTLKDGLCRWVGMTGLLEHGICLVNGGYSGFPVPTYKEMEKLVQSLRNRAVYTRYQFNYRNDSDGDGVPDGYYDKYGSMYLSMKNYMDELLLTGGFTRSQLLTELTGDFDLDVYGESASSFQEVKLGDEAGENNDLYFDNKKFILSPVREKKFQ